jgi:hypothetical protein
MTQKNKQELSDLRELQSDHSRFFSKTEWDRLQVLLSKEAPRRTKNSVDEVRVIGIVTTSLAAFEARKEILKCTANCEMRRKYVQISSAMSLQGLYLDSWSLANHWEGVERDFRCDTEEFFDILESRVKK